MHKAEKILNDVLVFLYTDKAKEQGPGMPLYLVSRMSTQRSRSQFGSGSPRASRGKSL